MATPPSRTNRPNLSCLLHGAEDARFEVTPIPSLRERPYDILVEIAFTGVCGSDVHFWQHGGINEKVRPGQPMTMGHEAAGKVAAVGSKVTKVSIGDHVAIEPGFPCRRCSECLAGQYNLCSEMTFAASPGPGPLVHGTLTTYFPLPEDFCYKLPDGVSLQEGVLIEPLSVAVHATRLVDVRPGQNVLVFGAGTVGLMSCAVAREFGAAKIVVVDINPERLAFATDFAATDSYLVDTSASTKVNADRLMKACSLQRGFDVVIEATGVASSVHLGLELIKKGGSYVQVGLGKPIIDFPLVVMSEKEITMKGCFRYGPGDFALATSLVARQKIAVKSLITQIVPFDRATDAWEIAKRGEGIKTLIQANQAHN